MVKLYFFASFVYFYLSFLLFLYPLGCSFSLSGSHHQQLHHWGCLRTKLLESWADMPGIFPQKPLLELSLAWRPWRPSQRKSIVSSLWLVLHTLLWRLHRYISISPVLKKTLHAFHSLGVVWSKCVLFVWEICTFVFLNYMCKLFLIFHQLYGSP